MGLHMLTVAWMQKEYLLSSVPQNWTHFFNSGKLNSYFWVQKTELIFLSPEKLKSPAWNTWQKKIRKNRPKHVQNTCGHFWKRFWAFLEFEFFFENLPRLDPPWNTEQFFLSKKKPQNTFGHLGTILDNFRTLNFFSLFPWNFSKSLPQSLSPENRTHFFKSWKLISYF